MTVSSQLTADLRKLVLRLEDDLRERLAQDGENLSRWRAEHQGALDAQRTSSAWQAWRDDKITQAAVAWILTTVFVRFAEDNALVRPVWVSGPGARRQEALDAQIVFFRTHPELTDREWLLEPVEYLKKLPATAGLVGEHSALWQVQPSGRMATEILEFWRQTDNGGRPKFDLADAKLSTRFLGDLYQDLSDYAKKTFALLQTPEFVEEFILDQTLTPALKERSLEGFKLIDPTCGSGHFLLGAFSRLTEAWAAQAPGMNARSRVQKALDAVHGVDLNPFAVAIAQFRLMVAALHACGESSLELAPAFKFNLEAGDSLLYGKAGRTFEYAGFDDNANLSGFTYSAEDRARLEQLLTAGRYDVVVGNPPYITVTDKALNGRYRDLYKYISGQLMLTVPFMERFFDLAMSSVQGRQAGWVGQITANSFMKRESGSKLIEEFLSRQDLRLVVDTSGAYIPGHQTPTVIVVGRRQGPVGKNVRAVLGVRGEPTKPDDPARGLVWRSIVSSIDHPGQGDEWVSVIDLPRTALARHPWNLSGGGAVELQQQMEVAGSTRLGAVAAEIGYGAVTREDAAFIVGRDTLDRRGISREYQRPMVEGEATRDWGLHEPAFSIWPYSERSLKAEIDAAGAKFLWPFRRHLSDRVAYGSTQIERGLAWFEYSMFFAKRYATPTSIAFAFVATHNHFVLDHGGKVFKQTAPVIKLPKGATEEDHLELLGILNSSAACFWMKSVCQAKPHVDEVWATRYEFNGTNMENFPLPVTLPSARARALNDLAQAQTLCLPSSLPSERGPSEPTLTDARRRYLELSQRMIALQEELDWEVYGLYGLISDDLTCALADLPEVALGERAFEIALARKVAAGEADTSWFDRHGSIPVTEIPSRWPVAYRQLVQRRLDLIESNRSILLLERPEYKRRWASESWEKQQERALRGWLLERLEERSLWFDRQGRPAARSISQIGDIVSRDSDFLSVLSLWDGSRDVSVVKTLTTLLTDEAVPYLAAQRLKDSGLRKFEAWEQTWDLQRREDAGEDVGVIPVPPKYTSADFRKASWWQARGKLDVPKERFVLYPDAGRSTDQTLLLGWAGWNHVEQFLALAAVMDQLVADGAPDEQLIPLVAGMGEILPWVKQWHADIDPAYGVSMADFCAQQFEERAAQIDRSHDQLKAWRPSTPTRGRRTKVTA